MNVFCAFSCELKLQGFVWAFAKGGFKMICNYVNNFKPKWQQALKGILFVKNVN